MLLSFCSSCGCLWERVTVKTRFYRPKRLSIFVLINIFCGLERSLHQFGPGFDTVFNSLLLSDSTLTNISIRNIWVTEAKCSCASIGRRWFAIRDFVAVQAPVELENISIFPRWSRDVVSKLLVSEHSRGTPQVRGGAFSGKWLCVTGTRLSCFATCDCLRALVHLHCDVMITTLTTKNMVLLPIVGVDLPCWRKKIYHQNTMIMRWKLYKFKDEDLQILGR